MSHSTGSSAPGTMLEMLYSPAARQRLRPTSEIARLLREDDELSARRRHQVETILAYAAEQGWLDYPIRQRLASGDDTVMLAALNELDIARFLHRNDATLEPNPPGRGRHIGEFRVTMNGSSFFLEVKTLILPPQDTYRSEAEHAIFEAASGIDIPALLEIELHACPPGGISVRDLRYYLQLAAEQMLAGGHRPPAYIHRSGLCLRALQATPLPDQDRGPLEVRFLEWQMPVPHADPPAEERWRERLLRALRGAYEQLPLPPQASLVVVVDHNDSTGDLDPLLSALTRGFLRPEQHRRLSAIGRYSSLYTSYTSSATDEHLAIIHNPWATQQLLVEPLMLPQVSHICPVISW